MLRPGVSALLAAVISLLVPLGAQAAESCVLSYVRGQGAEQCPDEARVRQAVAARLGYDPFVAWAKTTVHAQIVREGPVLVGRVYLADEQNRARGSRELSAPADRCDELVAAMALAISIAVDPMQATMAAPPALPPKAKQSKPASPAAIEEEDTTPRPGRAPRAKPAPPIKGPGARFHGALGAGPEVTTGMVPAVSAGTAVFGRLSRGVGSIALEAWAQAPASKHSLRGGLVRASLLLGSVEACLGPWAPWYFCGLVSLGQLRASGSGVSAPRDRAAPYFAAGGRLAYEFVLVDRLALRPSVDVTANVTRHKLELDRVEVWRAPPVAAAAGLALVGRIW